MGAKRVLIQFNDFPVYYHSELTSVYAPVITSKSHPWMSSQKTSPPHLLAIVLVSLVLTFPSPPIPTPSFPPCLLQHWLFSFSSLNRTCHTWYYQPLLTFSYTFLDIIVGGFFLIETRSYFNSELLMIIPCIYIAFYGSQRCFTYRI